MKQLNNDLNLDEDDFNSRLSEGDFVFVINEEGLLKTVLVPEEFDVDMNALPSSLKKIFKIFGINQLTNQTIH